MCRSFTFLPGHYQDGRWTESTCSLYREVPAPAGKLEMSTNHFASYFTEMCLRSDKMEMCRNMTHAFTVYRNVDFTGAFGDRTINVNSRHDCMERFVN